MRFGGLIASIAAATILLFAAQPLAIQAQTDSLMRVAEAKKQAAPNRKQGKKADAKKAGQNTQATPADYAAMPLAERAAIQFDLNWTNHYTGPADGDFSDRSINAVKAFQKDRGFRETGLLAENEREALAASALNRRERAGFRMVEDRVTGAQVGVPAKRATHESRARSGTRWQSAQGQFQIETFRIREPGATLATAFESQKKEPPNREIASSAMRGNTFVITGMQGLKRFLVRAEMRDLEIRGITVLYDQAIENTTDYIALGVVSAFAPFPGSGVMALIGPPSRSRIEYGTGIVVTASGHVVTDRQITEGCNVIQVAGHGDASRIADTDKLTLLRVFGASALTPAALVHDGAAATTLTLVGIADPQAQSGERAVSTLTGNFNGDSLEPPPRIGFAGAAAVDAQGRILGMVTLKAPVLASADGARVPAATIVPVNAIRKFLEVHDVTAATGRAGIDAARASVVRVICVRR